MDSSDLATLIITLFKEKGTAKGARNHFTYVSEVPDGVKILREIGTEWIITKNQIIEAIEVVRKDPSIYNTGPSRLRPYINNRRQSPLWALIRLIPLNTLLGNDSALRH